MGNQGICYANTRGTYRHLIHKEKSGEDLSTEHCYFGEGFPHQLRWVRNFFFFQRIHRKLRWMYDLKETSSACPFVETVLLRTSFM